MKIRVHVITTIQHHISDYTEASINEIEQTKTMFRSPKLEYLSLIENKVEIFIRPSQIESCWIEEVN